MTIFVVKNLVPELSLRAAFRGSWPFNIALVTLLLIVLFPQVWMYLPGFMK